MQAEQERKLDEYDLLATQAMWNRAAYHAKRLKKSQLFKRPTEKHQRQQSLEEMRKETDELNAWLATLRRKE